MVKILDSMMKDAERLLVAVIGVMAVWFVIWTWVRTRSIVPVLGSLLVGAVVIWGVYNMGDLSKKVKSDVGQYQSNGPQLSNDRGSRSGS
jgi:hypothetical protein